MFCFHTVCAVGFQLHMIVVFAIAVHGLAPAAPIFVAFYELGVQFTVAGAFLVCVQVDSSRLGFCSFLTFSATIVLCICIYIIVCFVTAFVHDVTAFGKMWWCLGYLRGLQFVDASV